MPLLRAGSGKRACFNRTVLQLDGRCKWNAIGGTGRREEGLSNYLAYARANAYVVPRRAHRRAARIYVRSHKSARQKSRRWIIDSETGQTRRRARYRPGTRYEIPRRGKAMCLLPSPPFLSLPAQHISRSVYTRRNGFIVSPHTRRSISRSDRSGPISRARARARIRISPAQTTAPVTPGACS